jgi:hypothetical protein
MIARLTSGRVATEHTGIMARQTRDEGRDDVMQHDSGLSGIDLDMGRRVAAICLRFTADWRAGRPSAISDYLGEVPEPIRPALRTELEAIDRNLRGADVTVGRPDSGPAVPSVRDEATVPPGVDATVDLGSSKPPAEVPRVPYFGDYELIREIARGGMGVIFRARQISLNRPVALKMILAGQLADEVDVKRFYTGAEAAANLDHPGIVRIYEVGQHEGQHYFSMSLVEGRSLAQRLADGPMPPLQAAALMTEVARAIEYAHSRGVIHRDLKPGNILLDQDSRPRVTDFGLAKNLESDSELTGSGQVMGTPSYMPPELARGNRSEVGTAADVYALGATLYALLTGRPPFQAATAMETLLQVVGEKPVPPRRLNAAIPRDLETICMKCLEKAPQRRYASARALAGDLERYLSGQPIQARPVGMLEAAAKWSVPLIRRHPVVAIWVGITPLLSLRNLYGALFEYDPHASIFISRLLPILSDAALTGAAAAAMFVPRRRQPVAIFLVAVAFAYYGYYNLQYLRHRRPKTQVEPPTATVILSAARGALIAIAMVSLWPLSRGRKPVIPVMLSLCAAAMVLSELVTVAWPLINGFFWLTGDNLWWWLRAQDLEFLSIAVLLGLGIGILCGELARRLSATLRGDPEVTTFWAMVGVLGMMTFVLDEPLIYRCVLRVIHGSNWFAVSSLTGVNYERQYNELVGWIGPVDRFVFLIILKAVFIGLGAALGGLIGALSSREPKSWIGT